MAGGHARLPSFPPGPRPPDRLAAGTCHREGKCGFHRRMHMSLLTLPKGRASEPARSRVGSQGRATVITLQPPSRRALGPQIPCGSPSPRAGWWAHKTKPIWRESVPIRETLLTHQGLYCLTPGTTTTTNNTKVQQDMLGVFGKEPPPLKHGHV